MQKFSADIVFPITKPPVKNGIIVIDEEGVLMDDVLDPATLDYSVSDVETYEGFICPGFVNAHCHLELSWLKNKMPEHTGLDQFIINLENIRREGDDEKLDAIIAAEKEMINGGILAAGDICNTNITFPVKQKSSIHYHNFIESFASAPEKAEKAFGKALQLYNKITSLEKNNSTSITPHAPYSLSKKLFQLIKGHNERTGNIISIHHQESEEENKFFLTKNACLTARQGNIKDMHFRFGVERSDFSDCGKRPLEAISSYIAKNNSLQLVHNTVATEADIDFALRYFPQVFWCFCPNANLYIEQKLPDFALFFNKGCKITLGTDSLASNKQLSILEELKTIRNNMPFLPLHEMLRWATYNGAEFLKITSNYGSFEKGKSPGIVILENVNQATQHLTRDSIARIL
ncbi:MAG: amidohydrolase family protein [Bacteroidota bacterium]